MKAKTKTADECRTLIRKNLKDLYTIVMQMRSMNGSDFLDYASAVGSLVADKIMNICELSVTLICHDYASPDGTLPFPSMKDLAKLKKECGLDFPILSRIRAREIIDCTKEFKKNDFEDLELIIILAELARDFLKELLPMARESGDDIYAAFGDVEGIIQVFESRFRNLLESRDYRDNPEFGRMSFIVLPKPEDEYTDEELDEIYRIRNKNKDKHLAPVYIMEIMMEYSSEDNRLGANAVVDYLAADYGIDMERKSVSRTLKQLQEADYLNEGLDMRSKYWYDPELAKEKRREPDY